LRTNKSNYIAPTKINTHLKSSNNFLAQSNLHEPVSSLYQHCFKAYPKHKKQELFKNFFAVSTVGAGLVPDPKILEKQEMKYKNFRVGTTNPQPRFAMTRRRLS